MYIGVLEACSGSKDFELVISVLTDMRKSKVRVNKRAEYLATRLCTSKKDKNRIDGLIKELES